MKKNTTPSEFVPKGNWNNRKTAEAKIIIIITYNYIIIVFIPNRARFNEKYLFSVNNILL